MNSSVEVSGHFSAWLETLYSVARTAFLYSPEEVEAFDRAVLRDRYERGEEVFDALVDALSEGDIPPANNSEKERFAKSLHDLVHRAAPIQIFVDATTLFSVMQAIHRSADRRSHSRALAVAFCETVARRLVAGRPELRVFLHEQGWERFMQAALSIAIQEEARNGNSVDTPQLPGLFEDQSPQDVR